MHIQDASFEAAISAHDAAVARAGISVWAGAEPTFTVRMSEAREWLSDALGDTKQNYACKLAQRLRDAEPGALVLRTLGRQYPHEQQPRWSLGLYRRRDGVPFDAGLPVDPLNARCTCPADGLEAFWRALGAALDGDGWAAAALRVDAAPGLRILFRCDGVRPPADTAADPRLARPSAHAGAIPPDGLVDELAQEGLYLVSVGCVPGGPDDGLLPCLELPAFAGVRQFLEFTARVAAAARATGLTDLVWRGFPPPVDASVAWTTLTPDPAVLEVNAAPAPDAARFLAAMRTLYDHARTEGLAPYRLQYNGNQSDSGGGGQFTLGGQTPELSPFFVASRLLPRLIVYLNRHPALSYWFAPAYVGSFSQSPRPDENVLESFNELQVALQHLVTANEPTPEFIWRSLSPFLVDTSGNTHRSELNIEKLWNPWLPGRGCLGLVEFRAFRMAVDAETSAAIVALLRAIAAMLSRRAFGDDLIEWGGALHERFALPFYMRQDLQGVFDDLAGAELGLGVPIVARLLDDAWRHLGRVQAGGCTLAVDQAIEFWPLLGDATQHSGGTRLVDASTSRIQITLRPGPGCPATLDGWQVHVAGYRVRLREERDAGGPVLVLGVRYRAFVPWTGLHPGLGAQTPLVLTLVPPGAARALRVTLHDWQPQGLAYPGLPDTLDEARRRVAERFVVEEIERTDVPEARTPPVRALTAYSIDLRRC